MAIGNRVEMLLLVGEETIQLYGSVAANCADDWYSLTDVSWEHNDKRAASIDIRAKYVVYIAPLPMDKS